jgi:L-fucose mutarotase/ribose pyranase (RbsD/FucU family)
MLKKIDPRLNADLLHVLALVGYGDELVGADSNFPAASTSCGTQAAIDRLEESCVHWSVSSAKHSTQGRNKPMQWSRSGERRFYGSLLLRKGVIEPV